MLPVVRTEQAEADLAAILAYLDEHSPAAADRLATAIDQRCALLQHSPEMGRARNELHPGLRSIAIDRYVLFYRITPTAVEVIRILQGSRDLPAIFRADPPPE